MVVIVLYFAGAVDLTVLVSLSAFETEQYKTTEKIEAKVNQLLDYLATNTAEVIQYHVSDIILNINLDASYLSETRSQIRVVRHYILGSNPSKEEPINMNCDVYVFKWQIEIRCYVCSRSITGTSDT